MQNIRLTIFANFAKNFQNDETKGKRVIFCFMLIPFMARKEYIYSP